MRKFLFHGKRKDNGEWVKGNLAAYDLICPDYPEDTYNATGNYCGQTPYVGFVEVIPETVGECTNIPDKNNVLIFEGHIVQFRTKNSTFKSLYVRWNNETAQFVASTKDGARYYPMDSSWEYEILGNIYDNPELLGE